MPIGDTIAAISSPPGRSARALIRLSGPATREVLAAVLDPTPRPFDRGCFSALLRVPPNWLRVLVATSRAPASFTGEDSAEILLPGNPHLLDRILRALTAIDGVRPASPGEFSARAYLNDRLSLDQAEGVAATIAAETDDQLRAAGDLLAGRTGGQYRAWAEDLTTLLALVEAGIDFTDQEDVVPVAPAALRSRLQTVTAALDAHLGAAGGGESASALPRIVLAGRPNAGKSTLFNALLRRPRAVVSQIAGTTRDALEEELDLSREVPGAGPILLVDLAGLDEPLAPAPIDAAAQARARELIARADVIIHCDPAGRFDLPGLPPIPTIRVRTKADLPGANAGGNEIAVCALDRWNLPVLRRAIADGACGSRAAGLAALLPRHRRALAQTRDRLRDAVAASAHDTHHLSEPELVASALRGALDALGELIGRISPDDVIGRIFATFCVGK